MKIGIITFHASHNYGSMLQAYALQTYLERRGHQVEIINFRTKGQKRMYAKSIAFGDLGQIKESVKRLLLEPTTVKPLLKKWHLFENFLTQHLHLTREYNTLEQLRQAKFDYDYVITGSDQIWNTSINDFNEAYFANFVGGKTRKVAYAPSMGPEPEMQNRDYVAKLLKGYTAVSVREQRTKDYLEGNGIFKPVKLVLDPTMLLDAKDYNGLYAERPLIEGDYVFYYTPGGIRPEFMDLAKEIGQLHHLPVVTDGIYPQKDMQRYKDFKRIGEVGPSEFLNLVKNATVVCGASFHLMVFSILFKRNFYCLNGDVDSRMNNLMKIMQTEDRIVSVKQKGHIQRLDESYDTTSLQTMKDRSYEFLSSIG